MANSKKDLKQENKKNPETGNEAIKNSEEVDAGKRQKGNSSDESAPDYPYYPPSEDILNPANDMERVDINVENISRTGNIADDAPAGRKTVSTNEMELPVAGDLEEESDLGIKAGTDADVTEEDLLLLGPKDQDMDMGDDEELGGKVFPLNQTGEDLDVPGEELDDANEEIGEEDEENNYYSIGGDNHENLEEDQAGQE